MPRTTGSGGWVNAVARANGLISVILFGGLTAVVALQVFTRFVLHVPFLWSEEAARFLFFWVVLLGSASSVRTRRHFVIDVTMGRVERWPRRARLVFDIIPDLCVLAYSAFLLVQGIGYVRVGLLRTATNSGVSMSLVYAAIPVFAALSVLYAAGNLVLNHARRDGSAGADESPAGAV